MPDVRESIAPPPAGPPDTRHGAWTGIAAGAAIALCSAVLFFQMRHFGLPGWDTYPLIVTTRVQSLGDFGRLFTQELMAGRYEGRFYRPLLNLSLAADSALGGLNPVYYQFSNILAFAAAAAALYWLARQLLPGRRVGPLAALLAFLVHPTHWEVLPVPARRPESLCLLFMALAVASQITPHARAARRPPWWPTLLTLAAVGAKETALLLPILIFAAVWLYAPRPTLKTRGRYALAAAVPHVLAVVLLLLVRLVVLHGIGGHESTRLGEALARLGGHIAVLLQTLVAPQPPLRLWSSAAVGALVLIAVAGVLLRSRIRHTDRRQQPNRAGVRRAALFAAIWFVSIGGMYAVAGDVRPWYLLLPAGGFALLLGSVVAGFVTRLQPPHPAPRGIARALALAGLAAAIALVGGWARYSPLLYRYPEWTAAKELETTYLSALGAQLTAARPGGTVIAPPLITWAQPAANTPSVPQIHGAAVLTDYSVQAWSDLSFPAKRVRVAFPWNKPPPPRNDEILVLIPRRMGK